MLDDFQDDDPVKNSGFLDEFRQRLNSQPIENLEERKKDISKSQHVFLGTILGVGLAGVASWFILSPEYDKTEDVELPVVRRTNTAVKIQPASPGGMEILNQDKAVYDITENNNIDIAKVENILPLPEEPLLPEIAEKSLQEKTDNIVSQSDTVIKEAEKIITQEEQKEIVANQSQEIKVEVIEDNKTVSQDVQPVAKEKQENNTIDKISIKETAEAKQGTQEKPDTKTNTNLVASGKWQIQLISSPNKAAIDKSWIDLTKKYPQLSNLSHEIESADLGTKGTFYRLKAGAFSTRSEADKLCNSIKTAGGSCLVKKKP